MNVWQMPYYLWCTFAEAAEEWAKARQKEAEDG
jgi:hypothetical protein